MKHRATGNPRGRPPKIPFDLSNKILDVLNRRMDPETRLVRPLWKSLAKELGVSRSTISRMIPSLKTFGFIESVHRPSPRNPKVKIVYYRMLTQS